MERRIFLKQAAITAAVVSASQSNAAPAKAAKPIARRALGRTGEELSIIGFGGIVEQGSSRPGPKSLTVDTSYTFPDASQPLSTCNGVGVAGLLRAQWLFVMGPRSSTGLALQLDGQWTVCVDDTGIPEPDTARPIVRRQWWPHLGGSLTWEI